MGQKYRVLLGFTVTGESRVYPGDVVDGDAIGDAKEIRYKQDRGFISQAPLSPEELATGPAGSGPAAQARPSRKAPRPRAKKKAAAKEAGADGSDPLVHDPFAGADAGR